MAALNIVTLDTATPQLEVPQSGDTYNAPRAVTINPVALTGSTATPALDIAQTWNTTGTPTGIRLSVTDTSSAAASNLMDLQVGGTSKFKVGKNGGFTASNVAQQVLFDGNYLLLTRGTSVNPSFSISTTADYLFRLSSPAALAWTSGGADLAADLFLYRDAANTLAQRNSTNAQAFRLYGTYTAADNFQRLNAVVAKTASGALSGASVTLSGAIPDGAVVVGVTSRVTTLLTGATGYLIGTSGDTDRFGDITGTAVGTVSKNSDWTAGTVECFTAATDIVLTAKTSDFTAGAIEVCVHYLLGDAD